MRIFLYEFVTGGGFHDVPEQPIPDGSLLTEGAAMWQAAYNDFARLEGVEVFSSRDARLPSVNLPGITTVSAHPREKILSLALNCDYTLIIAPEFGQQLFKLAFGLEAMGVSLLSPNSDFIRLTSDKTATTDVLKSAGINVPQGALISPGKTLAAESEWEWPAVVKVNDGAGSMCEVVNSLPLQSYPDVMRIEQMVNGLACSISFFCQAERTAIACPPMQQILSCDGKLSYLGGERIMDPKLVARATQIGCRAIKALPRTNGYVGIDLVLGDDSNGQDDYVIEVNPRLTTSYVGLRHIAEMNLAEAMLQIAQGEEPDVSFASHAVVFHANGTVI